MNELPNGWEVATIGDVTLPKVPQGAPEEKSTFTYVDISSVDNVAKRIASARSLVGKDAPSRARQHLAPNDVLVSMTRPNLNAVAKAPADLDGAIGSTGFDVLRCQEIEPDWIFYTVRSPAFVQAMSDLVQGALYPAVRSDDVRSYHIPLPPINEQRRIVAKLDALFEKSRSIREKLDRLPRLLANLQRSILNSAFRGDLTREWRARNPTVEPASEFLKRIRAERRAKWEADLIAKSKDPKRVKYVEPEPVDAKGLPELPKGWCWTTVDEICSAVRSLCYGVVQPGDEDADGVRLIRVCDLEEGTINISDLRTISGDVNREYKRSIVLEGDVLISVVGTIGRMAIVPPACDGMNIARAVARIAPIQVPSEWVRYWMESNWMQFRLTLGAREVARKTLNLDVLRQEVIPLAPFDEMLQIMKMVRSVEAAAKSQMNKVARMTDRQIGFEHSSLAAAFRGELIPQDPNDEPASVLLERIRAQKPVAGTKRGQTRRHAAPKGP